jgi:hypothetical protein
MQRKPFPASSEWTNVRNALSVPLSHSHTSAHSWRHVAYFRTADFEKIDEIHFRLGIIYKQLQRYTESLQVRQFTSRMIGRPRPLNPATDDEARNAVLRSDIAQSAPSA